jgi:type II secretory pathway component PulF
MRTLAEELPGRKLRKTFARMSDRLQNGDLLEKVVTDEGGALPPFLAGLLQTGVASDRLSECVERYVAFTRLRFDLRAQVWLSLLYPLVLAVIGGGLLFLLALTIFPQFKIIFEGFYVELPGLTRLIIGTGDVVVAIVNMGYAGLLLIAAIVWGMYVVVRYAALKRPGFWQTLYVIPIAGDVVRSSGISQFCYLMGIMVSRGVDLPQALQLTSQSLSDRNIALGTQRMSELIGAGHSPASLRRHVALPREILSLFIWKNENNELATALTASGELYAAQCDINAKCLSSIVTPLIVLVVGAAIAMSVFGLFMPLINLMNDLS